MMAYIMYSPRNVSIEKPGTVVNVIIWNGQGTLNLTDDIGMAEDTLGAYSVGSVYPVADPRTASPVTYSDG